MQYPMFKAALAASVALALSLSVTAHAQSTSGSNGFATRINASAVTGNATYNRFIVRYNASVPTTAVAATQSASAAMSRATKLQASLSSNAPAVSYKRTLATGAHLITTSRKLNASEAAAFMQSIASDPTVAYVQPDVMRHAIGIKAPASFTPNDNYFAKYQTDYLPGDGTATAAGNKVANWGGANVTGAWDLADGTGITIAVIDTGIVKHADIDASLGDAGYDFISDGFVSGRSTDGRVSGGWDLGDWTTGAPYDSGANACVNQGQGQGSSWHGSHVASASGAEITNNSIGMAGIAYKAKVLPVRALGHCGGYDSDIADAIVWASGGHVDGVADNQHPAQVINMSLGGDGTCTADDATAQAIAKARAKGTTVVVAAGNDGADVKSHSPASCPGVITVASTGVGSGLSFYSNYNAPGESIVKLAAFGGGVYPNEASSGTQLNPEGFAWQAVNNSSTSPAASPGGDTYGGMAGTSQATPHVTGAVALMQSARLAANMPLLTPDEVLAVLQKTARTPHTTPNSNKTFGAGILDAGAAVAEAVKGGGTTPPTDNATVLQNGVALTGQKGDAGSETFYKIDVPANARALVIRTAGGTGDVSLYVKAGAAPTATAFDASSIHAGNAESVTVAKVAAATTYYLRVVGVQAYTGVSVQATYTPASQ
ncbi:S8 family peptidase [Dyella kyungheensis]|uniref:S8 family serine peptidase n=2 Tax=Dyella kyungheensis TaxID=1242174 RepID=A0ABS2JYD4_9GAMM|nr:S8 family serine peptidase [Dyella kyungheensis]